MPGTAKEIVVKKPLWFLKGTEAIAVKMELEAALMFYKKYN